MSLQYDRLKQLQLKYYKAMLAKESQDQELVFDGPPRRRGLYVTYESRK